MNILYISNEYPAETGFGGIGTYTRHAAEGMASLGHTVHVIARSATGKPMTSFVNRVMLHRVAPGAYPLPRHRIFFPLRKWCYHSIPHCLQRLAWAREAYETYAKWLRPAIKFDIIEYPECGGEGCYFSHLRDTIRVTRLHTPWEMVRRLDAIRESMFDRLALSYIERSTARRASAVTCPSSALAKMLARKWKLKNIAVFPNPLPVSHYATAGGTDWIYTGRVEYRKGVHLLIRAYARLRETSSPPRLRLIGKPYGALADGTAYANHITRLIEELGCTESVDWIRGVPGPSIQDYLRQSSVAVFPSLWENFSYSCLEAMASGLAIVASRCGGYEEMITHKKNGLLFEPGNVEDLAGQLARLLAEPHLGKTLGAAARASATEKFDSSVVCRTMETFYRGLLKEGNP
jgi:glycogen synthase